MAAILVAKNTDKVIPPNSSLRDIDREDLVKLMIAFGLEPIKTEGDNGKIVVYFMADETEKFENAYLSNKDLLVPFQRIVYANEFWRNMMTLWKSKIRQLQAATA